MSGESESKIQDVFIDKLGAKYPFATVKESVKQAYGITAFPSYFTITPDGEVHSKGRPSEALIEELLQDVRLAPKTPAGPAYGPVRKMWEKKQYQKLLTYFDKGLQQERISDEMREVFTAHRAELHKRAKKQLERVAKYGQGPDYYKSRQRLERISKEWKSFEAEAAAKAELARFAKDGKIKKEIKAGKTLEKLLGKFDMSSISQKKKLMKALHKFAKSNSGTYAADRATKMLASPH